MTKMCSYHNSGSVGSRGRNCRNCGFPVDSYDIANLKPSSMSYGAGACGYSRAHSYSSGSKSYSAKSSGGKYR